MSSVAPYSVGTCLTSLHLQKRNHSASSSTSLTTTTKCSSVQQPPLLVQKENQLNRREAITLSMSFGLLHSFLQPLTATAAEAVPCELTVSPSGLSFCDKVVGTGSQAVKGQLIKAHYVGRLENGKVFDSSYDRGKPLTFRVGVGEVIKGWDEGILGGDGIPPMLTGGKRTLKLPPELGYGSRGAGCRGGSCVIPPDSVLLFDVEFVSKA
ncbi:peptidyl-prolyl cis-trans isomerase FKBP13, chloroplastic [Trifolium pratense]|nr:peptidyl-prolyl cis-trans isomerase FKBP13, chloroplastic [Trifolium pratense]